MFLCVTDSVIETVWKETEVITIGPGGPLGPTTWTDI